jgi:hypothetical protein
LSALYEGRERESGDFFPLKVVSTAKDCDTRAYTQYIDQEEEGERKRILPMKATVAKLKKVIHLKLSSIRL